MKCGANKADVALMKKMAEGYEGSSPMSIDAISKRMKIKKEVIASFLKEKPKPKATKS